ncbi:hypothetical protein UFOVP715_32 [uncultured Caudovirales phage]|uniref:Uncharacterized protein n=1 Tax=uncultured Caudovirales phage TaxID=2100421 RepID=A0A6J5NL25_9CAUD|nr:hypothetical protein UFOVP715_32 [uncultured Caudovirales phage]
MKVRHVEISLAELQQALRNYCRDNHNVDPEAVVIVSHSKTIEVELFSQGLVTAEEFQHRAEPAK